MFYACYIKWFSNVRLAFREGADIENPTFRIRTLFQIDDPLLNYNYTELEESFIQECYRLGNTSGCIAEQILPVTKEIEGKYWVRDHDWAGPIPKVPS